MIGCSTDRTWSLLEGLARGDTRLVIRRRPNSGRPAIPRNDGLKLARGEFVGFLDHDDYSEPERLGRMVEALDAHPAWVAAFHDIALVDADGRSLGTTWLGACRFKQIAAEHLQPLGDGLHECGARFAQFASLYTPGMHTQSVLIARRRIEHGEIGFDPRFLICEDTDLWIRLALMGPIGFLDRVLGNFRRHPTSLTTRRIAFMESTIQAHIHNYERVKPRFDAATLQTYRERIGGYFVALGWHYYELLQLEEARTQFAAALQWWPSDENRKFLARAKLPAWAISIARRVRRRRSS